MIVRSYGLADSYMGMILPLAINSTAVLAAPTVALFIAFQKHFTSSELGSGVKG